MIKEGESKLGLSEVASHEEEGGFQSIQIGIFFSLVTSNRGNAIEALP